jgi:NAD(P)-dependent dehydrogenase (short-subunit alcohol dehydrogenase family)
VISLTKTAAQQLGRHNINVNAVCPGIVRTALYAEMVRVIAEKEGASVGEIERRGVESVPLHRANEPEDIAAMIVFLASPGASNITGQAFNVDGGLVPN